VVVECDVRNDEAELAAKALMTFGAAMNRSPETEAGIHQKDQVDRARANRKARTKTRS
jgi:hypothetical protein